MRSNNKLSLSKILLFSLAAFQAPRLLSQETGLVLANEDTHLSNRIPDYAHTYFENDDADNFVNWFTPAAGFKNNLMSDRELDVLNSMIIKSISHGKPQITSKLIAELPADIFKVIKSDSIKINVDDKELTPISSEHLIKLRTNYLVAILGAFQGLFYDDEVDTVIRKVELLPFTLNHQQKEILLQCMLQLVNDGVDVHRKVKWANANLGLLTFSLLNHPPGLAKMLIERGADINDFSFNDSDVYNPLLSAIKLLNIEDLEEICKRDINFKLTFRTVGPTGEYLVKTLVDFIEYMFRFITKDSTVEMIGNPEEFIEKFLESPHTQHLINVVNQKYPNFENNLVNYHKKRHVLEKGLSIVALMVTGAVGLGGLVFKISEFFQNRKLKKQAQEDKRQKELAEKEREHLKQENKEKIIQQHLPVQLTKTQMIENLLKHYRFLNAELNSQNLRLKNQIVELQNELIENRVYLYTQLQTISHLKGEKSHRKIHNLYNTYANLTKSSQTLIEEIEKMFIEVKKTQKDFNDYNADKNDENSIKNLENVISNIEKLIDQSHGFLRSLDSFATKSKEYKANADKALSYITSLASNTKTETHDAETLSYIDQTRATQSNIEILQDAHNEQVLSQTQPITIPVTEITSETKSETSTEIKPRNSITVVFAGNLREDLEIKSDSNVLITRKLVNQNELNKLNCLELNFYHLELDKLINNVKKKVKNNASLNDADYQIGTFILLRAIAKYCEVLSKIHSQVIPAGKVLKLRNIIWHAKTLEFLNKPQKEDFVNLANTLDQMRNYIKSAASNSSLLGCSNVTDKFLMTQIDNPLFLKLFTLSLDEEKYTEQDVNTVINDLVNAQAQIQAATSYPELVKQEAGIYLNSRIEALKKDINKKPDNDEEKSKRKLGAEGRHGDVQLINNNNNTLNSAHLFATTQSSEVQQTNNYPNINNINNKF